MPVPTILKLLATIGLLVFSSACAVLPDGTSLARFGPDAHDDMDSVRADIRHCQQVFANFDTLVETAAAGDVQDQRIAGFPWYRIDRPLAALKPENVAADAFSDWIGHMADLDQRARQYEAQNTGAVATSMLADLDQCRTDMMVRDLEDPARRARLLHRAVAGSVYKPELRQAGLYELTSLGVARGYEKWKADNLHVFDAPPLESLKNQSILVYGPGNETGDVSKTWQRDALGLPDFSPAQIHALFQRYAPVLVVGNGGDFDRVGAIELDKNGQPVVDTKSPIVYQRLSHTVSKGKVLPQLVYSFWFSARPKTGRFDILGGELDGLILRVTLDENLQPVLYDSIHQCGCYHMSFPVPPWKRIAMPEDSDHRESILVPADMPQLADGQRPVLWMASASHYILGMTSDEDLPAGAAITAYSVADDNELRSLPMPNGAYRSMFGPTGIIEKSSRLERFILWPMGIENAGAMRQWGHHAIAFVGHRHFDDPAWFDQAFAKE